jgi:hypothetical protein
MKTTSMDKFRGLTLDRLRRSVEMRSLLVLGRLAPVRVIASFDPRRWMPMSSPPSALFQGVDANAIARGLHQDGLYRGLHLPAESIRSILEYANATPCYGNQNYRWGFRVNDKDAAEKKVGKRFAVGFYANTNECPAIRELGQDPVLNEAARRYIGPRARLKVSRLWWSFAGDIDAADRNEHAQRFHFDLDDYRFMKVFFYLTDVDKDAGPHVYVRGSHKGKKLSELFPMRRFSDEEVEARYAADRIVSIEGRAGDGFVEDTFGIHKGAPPKSRDRLLLQFEFAVHDYGIDDVVSTEALEMLNI